MAPLRRSGLRRSLVEGVVAGAVGTVAMTSGYRLEHRIRRAVPGPLDYDDSNAPALAAARVLHLTDPGPQAERILGLLVHWGYGSVVGIGAVPLVRRLGPVRATLAWWGAITVMAGVLFPVLGRTPPPWRWRRDVLVTSFIQHLVYAAVVVAVLEEAG